MNPVRARYTIPVARFEPRYDPVLDKDATPYIARLVCVDSSDGAAVDALYRDIGSIADQMGHDRMARNLVHLMRVGRARVFVYLPDLDAPPTAYIALEPYGIGDRSDDWFAARFATNLNAWLLTRRPFDATDPYSRTARADRIRRQLLWFLFDGLGLGEDDISEPVQQELLVPEIGAAGPDVDLEQVIGPMQHAMRVEQERLYRHAEMLDLAEQALTWGGDFSEGPGAQYVQMVGEPATPEHMNELVSRVHDGRMAIFNATETILQVVVGGSRMRHDSDRVNNPYRNLQISAQPWNNWHVFVHPDDLYGIVWELHHKLGIHLPARDPFAASTEGPFELLQQAGLVVMDTEAFDDWLDATIDPGELGFDPEAYIATDLNPLLMDDAWVQRWAKHGLWTEER